MLKVTIYSAINVKKYISIIMNCLFVFLFEYNENTYVYTLKRSSTLWFTWIWTFKYTSMAILWRQAVRALNTMLIEVVNTHLYKIIYYENDDVRARFRRLGEALR